MEPESTNTRPVSTYFAPAVRVRQLPAKLSAGAEPGDDLPADVLGDLLSAQVTLLNTGSSQYSLTFNNWYATTATDRAGPDRPGDRELASGGRPLWPRFKYNDFSLLYFGQRLRVDMRYWPDASDSGGTSSAAGLDAAARGAEVGADDQRPRDGHAVRVHPLVGGEGDAQRRGRPEPAARPT